VRRGIRIATGLAIVVSLQAAAWMIYRSVEDRRGRQAPAATFAYESASGPAPTLELELEWPDGTTVRLKGYESEPVIVHFWATWCTPCRDELPQLVARAKEPPGERRIRFLLISVDENWATVRHYFGGDIPRGVVRDRSGAARQAFAVRKLPETFVLGPGWTLKAHIRGTRDWNSHNAQEILRDLLHTGKQ